MVGKMSRCGFKRRRPQDVQLQCWRTGKIRSVDRYLGKQAQFVVWLQRTDQQNGVDRHRLNPIRINTFAADGFVGKKRGGAVMAVYPGIELPHPFLRRPFILQ